MSNRIYLYDSTLRDGAQTQGVDFSVVDKQEIAEHLDLLGIDYIEGGFPGANPTDDKFFADLPDLKKSRMVAFGKTRKKDTSAANDPGLNALVNSGVKDICIVGKASEDHANNALGVTLEENLKMISDSVSYLKDNGIEVQFDCEHFFDGYKSNPEYSIQTAKAAYDAGAKWVILCDTNGGTLPHEVAEIVEEVTKHIPGENLGIHCHNDTDNAVANSIAAVRAGVRQVQGSLNGYGERCGNTNLISLIPTLAIKMGYDVGISDKEMKNLTKIANSLDDRLNRPRYKHAAYIGSSSFAHKGGMHVSAVMKNPSLYEHIDPEAVGNERLMLVSNQAGKSNIVNRLKVIGLGQGLDTPETEDKIIALVDDVKEREDQGYAYDSADASFELLAKRHLQEVPEFFTLKSFRVIDELNEDGVTVSEASVHVIIDGEEFLEVAEGNGPINALNRAMKKTLVGKYPQLENIRLVDYKVRIITPERGSEAVTRVQVETSNNEGVRWSTVGVSPNIINASYNALHDAIVYKLLNTESV